jgi:hypothetical protein
MPLYKARALAPCIFFFLFVPSMQSANRPLPETVNVKAFAKRNGGQLELLVRVPLAAVKDVDFPARGDSGYLDLNAVKSMLSGVARYWIADCFEVEENGAVQPKPEIYQTRISLSSDRSFDTYRDALASFSAPELPPETNVLWDQVWLDIHYAYPLRFDRSVIAIRPKVAGLGVRVSTDMKYVEPEGGVRDFSFEGNPGLIYVDARWTDAARQFGRWGFVYVAGSADLLLLFFCLTLPLLRYRDIGPAIVAFLAALSIALLLSASGFAPDPLWFHPLIDTLSAVAILLTAFANIAGRVTQGRRALLALGLGFVFGFRCSFDFAAKAQFGGSHPVLSAMAFDGGVVSAVVLAVLLIVPILSFLFRFA